MHAGSNHRSIRVPSRFWLGLLLLVMPFIACASDTEKQRVTLGLPAFWDKEETRQQWQPLADYLTSSIPTVKFEIQVLNLTEMEQAVANQDIDFLFTNPSLYVYYTYRYGLSSPLATVVNQLEGQDVRQFAGVIFTRADRTDLQQLSDLRGKRLAAVSESSLAAYQMQQYELQQVGVRLPDQADMLFTGLPLPRVVEAVLSGTADAGFVRAGVLESMQLAGSLEAGSTRLIGTMTFPDFPIPVSTRLYPEWPFAALGNVPEELSRQVAGALLSLPRQGIVAQQLDISGFTVPGDYRMIDQLLQELRLPPFNTPSELTFREVWERWQYHLFTGLLLFALLLASSVFSLRKANQKLLRSQEHIHHLAYHDALTNLPNRVFLLEMLQQQLIHKLQPESQQLVLLNLDRFKTINNARGSHLADLLLKQLSRLLQTHLGNEGQCFRMGADEFALLVKSTSTLPQSLFTLVSQPIELEGERLPVSISMGYTFYPLPEDQPEKVLSRASTALDHAKRSGGSQQACFQAGMAQNVNTSFEVERELPHAIHSQQLQLYLQPQVNASGQRMAAEVLVRWQHPEKGLLPPGQFIPVAEKSNLIVELGNWVLRESCKLMADADSRGINLRLAVNISPRHFRQTDFVPRLSHLLAETGINPHQLTLEITESLVIDNLADIISKMQQLRNMGIHFSIDDFGTGYSSLAYLKRLPIHEIKIDRGFVQDAPTSADDAALVETILAVAEKLKLQVVAEGVETSEQAAFLNARATVLHQGYLYGRPEPAEDWLQRWQQ
ncbi:MAG: EAL domain-containing protein [Marinospirillum sp.]|uniref:putative bifunctional diguanylate cyclase/phosphodiesterase n=1 Tax=Marinospirillum sp. TaxID=2183934 RepID=UPI0019DD4D47|nr:EAL domain-containing protein [Marinospirillum sp.]MBE0508728.1 EAL domain-containing protein [Marinospirillum sp.]